MIIRIFKHYLPLPLVVLAAVEAAIAYCAVYIAVWLRFETFALAKLSVGPLWPRAAIFMATIFVALAATGLYSARQRSRFGGLMARIAFAIVGGACILILLFYAVPVLFIGRGVLIIAASSTFVLLLLMRLIVQRFVDEDIFKRRVIVYGAGNRAGAISQLRRRTDRRGFMLLGYIRTEDDPDGVIPSDQCIRAEGSLLQICNRLRVDEIVVAMDDRRRQFPMRELLECRLDGIEVTELVSFFERETGKLRLDMMNPSWMILSSGFHRGYINAALERAFDLLASSILLIISAPMVLLTVVAIKIEDGWRASVFYSQIRVGQYGRDFALLKFRSMREDAERDGKARWAVKNDARVTRVGAIIRKTRIDEIPQILNVLRGQMSFVGPRPERPAFVNELNDRIPYYRERHVIKPGITGWAQLCYPYGSSEHDVIEKLQYDLYYVKNHSVLFYLAILVQTVEVVLWRKGAR